ncbi:MAG: hypothetical protein ACRDJT_07590 [Actinomycetota bacterium]
MWIGRLRRELKELSRDCTRAADDEETASFELTRSARAFSQRAREVANDKLAFSATLMRAGEVGAANRLIHDLERDVRTEEAALAEQVNEIKVAIATRRSKMTRLRLARTLAAAVFTAGLLSFSAAGMAVASFLADLNHDSGDVSAARTDSRIALTDDASARDAATRNLRLPDGTSVNLTRAQFRALKSLATNPNLDRDELERLLIKLVGPKIAGQLASVIADVIMGASEAAGELSSTAGAIGTHAGKVESNVKKELGSSPTGGEPSSKAPESDDHEQVEKPSDSAEKPQDDDVIDAPLGTKPDVPPVLGDD